VTVGELKKAIEEYLVHGEEDDAVVIHVLGGFDADPELDHEQYAFGLKVETRQS
jgi:hypothetical protein